MMAYQIKISLDGSKPPVWRKVLIPENLTFKELHFVIQAAMGWSNSHLFAFRLPEDPDTEIGIPFDDGMDDMETKDARKTKIKEYLNQEKDKLEYEYDFGDSWLHTILLEKITDEKIKVPQCLSGKGACPPDDSGGLWGYYELVETVNNPKSPDYEEMREWMELEDDEKWDVNAFDLQQCNAMVQRYKELAAFDLHD
jgi:hypothetical protein